MKPCNACLCNNICLNSKFNKKSAYVPTTYSQKRLSSKSNVNYHNYIIIINEWQIFNLFQIDRTFFNLIQFKLECTCVWSQYTLFCILNCKWHTCISWSMFHCFYEKNFFYQLINDFYLQLKNWRLFFYYSNVHFFLGDVYLIYFTIFQEILIKYEVIFLAMLWCSAHLQYTFLSFQWWNLPTDSVYGVDTCALRTKLYCSTERRPTLWSSNTSMKLMI